ncbi:MAG TPA: prepilin peptidase [Gammaproteobacteria bacterium]|nr:prepilin peptidase [Gammaproteobacteria bacterium]
MHNAAAIPAPWPGSYPERLLDAQEARDRQFWRTLGTPWWSSRQARWRGEAFVARVEARDSEWRAAGDEQLGQHLRELRRALSLRGFDDDLTARSFALVCEVAHRRLGLRAHPTQLLGGWAMLNGMVAEMATGEGKTLAIAFAAATAALAHVRTHVITVNDYLADRDARELAPLYAALGLRSVGLTPSVREPAQRSAAWRADVVYCSNKSLVFDYLRDRVGMGQRRSPLHRELDRLGGRPGPLLAGLEFGIVDEADGVLIDECRLPLVLSRERPALYEAEVFAAALELATHLRFPEHYEVYAGERRVKLTEAGRAALAELAADRGAFWAAGRRRDELVRKALTAQHLFTRDEHYLVRRGRVEIIDPNTGRAMPDRSWELGLHQMIDVKEGCAPSGGKETIARITYQRFFSRYQRLGATTGTAREVASELWRVYGLRVLRVPRHRANRNRGQGTAICAGLEQHCEALIARVRARQSRQQPVLLATRTVAASERLSNVLAAAGLPHTVLNARNEVAEAAIVAQAGQAGRITIATNMAGRGTDIKLGSGVELIGGLHVIVAECNESKRLDRQLTGRAGRQGDPGSHECVLSLDDELLCNGSPAWLRVQLSGLLLGAPRLGRLLTWGLLRFVRWRLERRAARQRRLALQEDRRIGDALSFSGLME